MDRHRGLGGRRSHAMDVVRRGEQRVEVAGHECALLGELEPTRVLRVNLLGLRAPVETDEPPREMVIHRCLRARRDDEREERERAVAGTEEQPLPDPAAHAAIGRRRGVLRRQPPLVCEQGREARTDRIASRLRRLRDGQHPTNRGDELTHRVSREDVLVGAHLARAYLQPLPGVLIPSKWQAHQTTPRPRRRQMLRTAARFLAVALALAFPVAAGAALDPFRLSFDPPSQVSADAAYQAAEPSIRVDAFSSPTQRIWIAAPSGIGVNTRSLAGPEGGDLFWYSDDDGYSWHFVTGPEGLGSPTMVGGGDSDIATAFGSQVYGTGLTLVNITLAASCAEGEDSTITFNPISALSAPDDRQWIDTYEDSPAPFGAPSFVVTYGNIGAGEIFFNQVQSPGCAPPVGGPDIDR